MKSQTKYFWLATAAFGLLVIASAWVIGQDLAPDANSVQTAEQFDVEHDAHEWAGPWEDARPNEEWVDDDLEEAEWEEDEFIEDEGEAEEDWSRNEDEEFENEKWGGDDFEEEEFEEGEFDEDSEFGREDEWREELLEDEDDLAREDWGDEFTDACEISSVDDLELWMKLGDIASSSEETALLAVQLVGSLLDQEQAIPLLEESIEVAPSPAVKRLAKLRLVELYSQHESSHQAKEHLRQLIQGF